MRKTQLIEEIYTATGHSITRKRIGEVLNIMFGFLYEAAQAPKGFKLPRIGQLKTRTTKPRSVKLNGQEFFIPARKRFVISAPSTLAIKYRTNG